MSWLKLPLALLLLLALAGVSAWLAQVPGSLTFYWLGYRVDTSVAVAVIAAVVLGFAAAMLWGVASWLLGWRARRAVRKKLERTTRGMEALTTSMIALGLNDAAVARRSLARAQRALGATPLVHLAASQVARARGEVALMRDHLEAMLLDASTEALAAKQLCEYALSQNDAAAAMPHAQRWWSLRPKDGTAARAFVSLLQGSGRTQEAQRVLDQAAEHGALKRDEIKKLRATLSVDRARALV